MSSLLPVVDIRDQIIADLQKNMPEYLWKTGEPLVDILDSVGEFHYKREIIEQLSTSMNTPEGFRRLIYDNDFRTQVSSVLGLSMYQRTQTWIGVPGTVNNDFDAFVWYYIDRFGERRGFKRGGGQAGTGECTFQYPAAVVSGSATAIFRNGNLIYKATFYLDGAIVPSTTVRQVTGIIQAIGYGARYNVPADTLSIESISGSITSLTGISYRQYDITGGTDYESNEKFLQTLSDAVLGISGLGTRPNIVSIMADVDGIDKYLIKGTAANRRFLGSTDIYIQGSTREQWTADQVVGSDGRVLVKYQPCSIVSVTTGSPAITLAPEIQTVDGDYEHSVREVTYLDFAVDIAAANVSVGDTVTVTMLVNTPCVELNRLMNYTYTKYYEYARDWNIYEAQDRSVNMAITVQLKSIVDPTLAISLITDAITKMLGNIPIEGDLDYTDLINAMYGIYYQTDVLVDSVETMTLTTIDSLGVPATLSAPGTLTLDDGEVWVPGTITVMVV